MGKVRKGKEVATLYEMEQDAASSMPIPIIKRLRIRVSSPPPQLTEGESQTIKLCVPPRGKSKGREDQPVEENEHSMFDDILSVEERDVRKTTIGMPTRDLKRVRAKQRYAIGIFAEVTIGIHMTYRNE